MHTRMGEEGGCPGVVACMADRVVVCRADVAGPRCYDMLSRNVLIADHDIGATRELLLGTVCSPGMRIEGEEARLGAPCVRASRRRPRCRGLVELRIPAFGASVQY